jgi:hypothetical protein
MALTVGNEWKEHGWWIKVDATQKPVLWITSYTVVEGRHWYQGCHKERFWRKITVRTSFSSGRPHLPRVLVVVAGLERENFFSIFGFQSPNSPNSPNSPSSASFAGEAARRRRFFRPSSPSHPSKLYSSLGWLNSKVPKPFPPFSIRLIDVDGF